MATSSQADIRVDDGVANDGPLAATAQHDAGGGASTATEPHTSGAGKDADASVEDCPVPALCGKSAGRPRASDVQARLQNLLDTAAVLFLEHGYSNVSLEAIARQAHVAVRTIYVKFGGKAGLLKAVITAKRERYFTPASEMRIDKRPLRDILADIGLRFLELVYTPGSIQLHRMVIAEAMTNPELAQTFYEAGPQMTRNILIEFFSLPHIIMQFRPELALDTLATHMINCMLGDQLGRFLVFTDKGHTREELQAKVELGLDLFLRSTLR